MTGIRVFTGLLIVFFATSAYAECYTVFGRLQLEPDNALCSKLDSLDEEEYLGQCFKVITKGNAVFKGVSGLTSSPVLVAVEGYPGVHEASTFFPNIPIPGIPLSGDEREGLLYFTGRGSLTGKILTIDGLLEGSINTVDTGTMDEQEGVVVEIIRIDGGEGDFEGASGRILVYGPEIAPGWATYRGKICIGD